MQSDPFPFLSSHDGQPSGEPTYIQPSDFTPYSGVYVKPYTREKLAKKFPKILHIAEKSKVSGLDEREEKVKARRLIALMWGAAKLLRDSESSEEGLLVHMDDRPKRGLQLNLFPDAKKEITATPAEKLEEKIDQTPELRAYISCFHLMRREEARDKKRPLGYLDRFSVPATKDIKSLHVIKGHSYKASHIADRIIIYGKQTGNPMMSALGGYFKAQLEKRKDELLLTSMLNSSKRPTQRFKPDDSTETLQHNAESAGLKQPPDETYQEALERLYKGWDHDDIYRRPKGP